MSEAAAVSGALFIIPVMQVFFVFFAILCGGIFFQEFLLFTSTMWVGFIFGVLMILGGVYGLAPTDVDVITVVPVTYDPNDPEHLLALTKVSSGRNEVAIAVPGNSNGGEGDSPLPSPSVSAEVKYYLPLKKSEVPDDIDDDGINDVHSIPSNSNPF